MTWIVGVGIFLLLLFVFPRQMLRVTALCGAVVAGFFLWFYVSDFLETRKRESVSVYVSHDATKCGQASPLFIQIVNESSSTLKKVYFGISAHRAGFSDAVIEEAGFSSDRIIQSHGIWRLCLSSIDLNRSLLLTAMARAQNFTPASLEWSTTSIVPHFQK